MSGVKGMRQGPVCGVTEADNLYRESLVSQDLAFQKAFLSAVFQGLEKAPGIPSLEEIGHVVGAGIRQDQFGK